MPQNIQVPQLQRRRFRPTRGYLLPALLAAVLLSGCSAQQHSSPVYPGKPADTENKKSGAAMLFYEQAEKDMDVNTNITVIPPEKDAKDQEKSGNSLEK